MTLDETPILIAGVPPHLLEGLRDYALHGTEPGGFLTACLSNNLMLATGYADDTSLANIGGICRYIHNAMPSTCWGSPEKVKGWIDDARANSARTEADSVFAFSSGFDCDADA